MTRLLTIAALATTIMIGSDVTAAAVFPIPSAPNIVARRGPYPPKPEPEPIPEPQPKPTGRWIGPCEGWWLGENLTPASWNEDPERGEEMMMRLIVCVFAIFAPGESAYALAIADRESSFYPFALNESSGASGLFQHLASYWPSRSTLLNRGWFGKSAWPASVFDPRANAIVTAIMVKNGGWGPWS